MIGHPKPDPVGPGQESVWQYPRPAICQPTSRRIQVIHHGVVLADTSEAFRTLETSHPPTYYIPPQDVSTAHLESNRRRSLCEWKGQAAYHDVVIGGERIEAAVWHYSNPTPAFESIGGYFAFYPAPFEQCLVDGESITPQPGGFYGGWISQYEAGPFKGISGSRFW